MSSGDSLERRIHEVAHEYNREATRTDGAWQLFKQAVEEDEPNWTQSQQDMYRVLEKQINALHEFTKDTSTELLTSQNYNTKRIDVVPLAKEIFELYRPHVASGIEFKLFAPSEAFAHSDDHVYANALGNFVDNAIKYTSKGKIHVAINTNNDLVTTSVADTGYGIPRNKLHRVFAKGNEIRKEQGIAEGHGYGLHGIRSATEALRGGVGVESILGTGSIFYVHFNQA